MNQAFLQFLVTKNYKNLFLENPTNLKSLNIFIGSNGSGKSNYINCLKFLKDCLITVPDDGRGVSSFENAIAKIGSDRILDISVDSPAIVRLAYCFYLPQKSRNNIHSNSTIFDLELNVYRTKRLNLNREDLYSGEILQELSSTPFYYYQALFDLLSRKSVSLYNKSGEVANINFKNVKNIPPNSLFFADIPRLLEYGKQPVYSVPVYIIRRNLIELVSKWQFYNANNMDLNKIRMAEPKIGGSDIYVSTSGDNLALVIDNLILQDIDFEESINRAMKAILPKSRRLRPIRSGRLSLTLEWYVEDIKEPFYLDELSDGTVRMLCWATILHSPVLPSLLVIDEPELGLHVSWMSILAEWLKKASTKTQVIVTTHSPDLLDHFTDCLENVFCFYSEDKGHFGIKTLSKEMLDEKLKEGWELGDLYRVGDPSIGGWPW